jgi:putative FmdB family regulatory protein
MPLYEHRCLKCGQITELLRQIKLCDDDVKCSDCGGRTERITSRFSVLSAKSSGRKPGVIGNRAKAGSNIVVSNSRFENCQTCFSLAPGSKVRLERNTFKNVERVVEVRKK